MIAMCSKALGLKTDHDGLKVFEYINSHDSRVNVIFKQYCDIIATVIFNTQSVIDVGTYAIGGGISSQPLVIEGIQNSLEQIGQRVPLIKEQLEPIKIVSAKFRNDANLYGALYALLVSYE